MKATWGQRCNVLLFMSSEENPELPAIKLPVGEGRDNLWGKTKEAFKYIRENHMQEAEWFLKVDDDTYVILENLRLLLSRRDTNEPTYFGRRFKPFVDQGYMSGGAGYVLSREAVRLFTQELKEGTRCRKDNAGMEDVEMGKCLEKVGVKVVDSRDSLGRETFHPFVPEHHLIPSILKSDNWIFRYNYYPFVQVCTNVQFYIGTQNIKI